MTIEERNTWFNGLTVDQKRIEIAKDVIAQVETKKYIASPGTYFFINRTCNVGDNLQLVIEEGVQCEVCGIGGLFASRIRLGNDYLIKDEGGHRFTGYTNIFAPQEHLNDIFDELQYRLIEVAFEGDDAVGYFTDNYNGEWVEDEDGYEEFHIDYQPYKDAVNFYWEHDHNPNNRLIAIMENIIENHGVFVP